MYVSAVPRQVHNHPLTSNTDIKQVLQLLRCVVITPITSKTTTSLDSLRDGRIV